MNKLLLGALALSLLPFCADAQLHPGATGGPVTSVDGGLATIGAKADSVCGTATGTCTLQQLTKYIASQVSSAIPVNVGGSATAVVGCQSSAIYDASTNGKTQLVALSGSQNIRVCGYSIFAAGTVNVSLSGGTGTNCATTSTNITPAYQLTAQTGIVDGSDFWRGLAAGASNELCIVTSAGVAVQAIVYYTQY